MAVPTDIISLQLIAEVNKSANVHLNFNQLVHKLQSKVAHFDWVGLYLFDPIQHHFTLKASSGEEAIFPIHKKSLMQVPLYNSDKELLGHLNVASKYALDPSDFHALEALTKELAKKINNTKN